MNETCDRCGPAVRAVCHASRDGQLYLCGHCADQLRPALSAQGWAIRPVAVPLLAAGFIAGAGLRALTASVIRTKMGARLMILLGWPAVAVLAWALARSTYLAPGRAARQQAKAPDRHLRGRS